MALLHLEDALSEAPQTQQLLEFCERESIEIHSLAQSLHQACLSVQQSQNNLNASIRNLIEVTRSIQASFLSDVSAQVGLAPDKIMPLTARSSKEKPSITDATSIKSEQTPTPNAPPSTTSGATAAPPAAPTAAGEPRSGNELASASGKETQGEGQEHRHNEKEASAPKEQAAEGEALVAYLQGQRCLEDLIEELSESASVAQVGAAQLAELMMYPVDRFLRADLDALEHLRLLHSTFTEEYEQALQRYMRLSRRRDAERVATARADVQEARSRLLDVRLRFIASLNALRYKRAFVFLEPLSGYLQVFLTSAKLSTDLASKRGLERILEELNNFLAHERRELQLVKQKYEREMTQLRERVRSSGATRGVLDQQPHSIALEGGATATAASSRAGEDAAVPRNASRSGYLFLRQKPSLLSSARWERSFLFTQAGSLLCLAKDQLAASSIADLAESGARAEVSEMDDRFNVFSLSIPGNAEQPLRTLYLQAESEADRYQWIVTINALAGYVGQDRVTPLVLVPPSAPASMGRAHAQSHSHSASPASDSERTHAPLGSPRASTSRSVSEASEQPQHSLAADLGDEDAGAASGASRATLSEKAFGFFGGLLKGTTSTSKKTTTPSAASSSSATASLRPERTSSLPQSPSHAASEHASSRLQTSAMEPVLAIAQQPIQFELVDLELPGIEALSTPASTAAASTSSLNAAAKSADSAPPIVSAETTRAMAILRGLSEQHSGSGPGAPPPSDAPLVITSEQPAAPTFLQHFVLRFVGCVQVGAERGDAVVIEALRAMLMARARYDILRYQELTLVVSDFGVLLLDSHSVASASTAPAASSQYHVKLVLALEHVTHYAIHKDNNRLFGLICRLRDQSGEEAVYKYVCYSFECPTPSEELVNAFKSASRVAFQAALERRKQQVALTGSLAGSTEC